MRQLPDRHGRYPSDLNDDEDREAKAARVEREMEKGDYLRDRQKDERGENNGQG